MSNEFSVKQLDTDILNKVSQSLEECKFHLIKPEKDLLDKILGLNGYTISSLDNNTLSSYLFALAQYQIFIQTQVNIRNIKYVESKRAYDLEMAREIQKTNAKTIKEKNTTALLNSPILQELEKDMRVKYSDHIIFDKIPDSIAELSNALKKEIALRGINKSY